MTCGICTILENPSPEERALRVLEGGLWNMTLRRDQEYLGISVCLPWQKIVI